MTNHIIHKQQVFLNIAKEEQAVNFQSVVSALFRDDLSNSLESIFDEIASPGEVVRLDTLSLNLGTLTADNFEQEFKERFLNQIKSEVLKKKQEVVIQKDAGLKASGGLVTQSESLRDSLIYFLQFGSLPWYAPNRNMEDWESEIIARFSNADWHFLGSWLQKKDSKNHVITERLTLQFSDIFLEHLLSKTTSQPAEEFQQLYHDLHFLLTQFLQIQTSVVRNDTWRDFLHYFLIEEHKQAIPVIITKLFVLKLTAKQLETLPSAIAAINDKIETKVVRTNLSNLVRFLEKENRKNESRKNEDVSETSRRPGVDLKEFSPDRLVDLLSGETSTNIERQKDVDSEKRLKELLDSKEKSVVKSDKNKKAKSIAPEDVFYVSNTGIVILHPFLESYFTELELIEDKKFLNEDSCSRAVLLLHYLATGNESVAEFDLAFQKILCGFPLEETLPAQIELTGREKEESAKLLQTITDYWPPLKNTSAEGLQSSFLQRDGKLRLTDTGWLVVIEQKTIDILLGRLPWGFSTIRLPWMKEMLSVEWC